MAEINGRAHLEFCMELHFSLRATVHGDDNEVIRCLNMCVAENIFLRIFLFMSDVEKLNGCGKNGILVLR